MILPSPCGVAGRSGMQDSCNPTPPIHIIICQLFCFTFKRRPQHRSCCLSADRVRPSLTAGSQAARTRKADLTCRSPHGDVGALEKEGVFSVLTVAGTDVTLEAGSAKTSDRTSYAKAAKVIFIIPYFDMPTAYGGVALPGMPYLVTWELLVPPRQNQPGEIDKKQRHN